MKSYSFDPALEARSVFKERLVWMLFMGIVFFLLYGSANQLAGITAPHPSWFMEWERSIPFVEPFIVPYMSSDLMFVIAFLLPYTRYELRILAARVLFIIILSVSVFLFFPLAFAFEKPPVKAYGFLFGLLAADQPYNQLPSLHISFAVVLWASMRHYLKPLWLKAGVAVWFVLIALSTLLVYQHHFIDLPTGLIVGLAALYLIGGKRRHPLLVKFTTPRSLKMGLYYLMGATAMILGAFLMPQFAWLFLWIFLSLFGVSVVYAFGFNELLAGKNAKPNLLQWALFFPYFLGNYFSWRYYKRKLPLAAELAQGVYLGRQPAKEEYGEVIQMGVAHIINLATEQQMHGSCSLQKRIPFLDQTIPSAEMLHEGVLLIERMKHEGVYVHCALGLSRSVLLVSAWLLYLGYTPKEAEAMVAKVRPAYVTSPYMNVALDIYQNYLKGHDADR